jgi:hypothetical protein
MWQADPRGRGSRVKYGSVLQRRLTKLEAAVEVLNPQDEDPEIVSQAVAKLSVEDLRLLRHFARNQAAGSPLESTPEYQAVIRRANALYAEALAQYKASSGKLRVTW